MRSFLAVAGIGGPGSSAASSSSFTLVNRANTGEIKQIFNNLEGRDPNQQVIILNNYLGKDTRIMEGAEKMLSVPGIPEFLRQQVERELFNARSRIEAITTKRNEIQVSILKRGPALTTNPSLTHGNIAKTDKIFTYMQGMASSEQLKILDRHLTKHTRIMEGAEKMLSVPDIAEFLRQQVERELSHARSRIDAITAKRKEIQTTILKRELGYTLGSSSSLTLANSSNEILDVHLRQTGITKSAENMLSVPVVTVNSLSDAYTDSEIFPQDIQYSPAMPISSAATGSELLAKIENFIGDMSCEAKADSKTIDAVRTVAEACFLDQSISVHDFIRRATSSLRYHPNLVRKLSGFLQVSGDRLEVVVDDSISMVELIVIHGRAGGHIYPVSDAIQVPPISNTATLRALLDKDTFEHDFTKATSATSWAGAVAELLQDELKRSSIDMAHSMKCLRHLRRLAAQKGILPPSFFLHNVVRDGPHPVFGGGFADVYKGKLNGEVVCLKALRFFVERPEMARKLLNDCCREALVWNQLDHPNVLPFLGVNVDLFAPSFCLVSPWMSNGNLMQYLQRNPDFERRNAIIDIAAAMKYLHEYSPPIVHADIRGANVLVRDDLRCCLADFGLSSITTSFTLTSSSGNGAGSVRWLAPELFLMSEEDKSCMKSTSRDIYAFACTILEVYTGQPPFSQHKFDPPVMYDVLAGRRPSRPLALPNDLWTLVESCWQHDPALRPSAQAVMRDLRIDSVDLSSTVSSVNPAPASVALLLPPGPKGSMDEKNNPKPTSPSSTMKSSHTEPGPFNFKDINYVEELVHLSASQTDLSLDEDKENISFPFNVGDRDRRVTNGWQDEQDIDDDATFYATNSKLYISPARRQTSTRLSGNSDLFSPSSSNSSYINLDLR